MKAILYTEYGSPDVLRLTEIEKPAPKEGEVLVKVHTASANPLDWHLMRGAPFLARLEGGLRKPKNHTLGADFAGVVESVGAGVTEFKAGDAVFGSNGIGTLGAFADYICVQERYIVPKPANISFEQGAGVGVAALTALQGLRDYSKIQAGEKVLVNGASGGVGSFAVQIAKAYGAEVTGVCSTRNVELVRGLGADHVIDYTKGNFADNGAHYDLIFDTIGNLSIANCRRALLPNGRAIIAGFQNLPHLFRVMLIEKLIGGGAKQKVSQMGTATTNKKDLLILKDMLESGKITTLIDKSYPLTQTAEAIRYLEAGHARGKVLVAVGG